MTEVTVYATLAQAATTRAALAEACRSTGIEARLELFGTGSLFQRLGARRAPPLPDVVLWFGPYAAQAAATQGLLQPHQPSALPPNVVRHPDWLWTAAEFQPFRVSGTPPVESLEEITGVPRLALADPERSEVGLMLLLATLDRARATESDVENAWAWWTRRVRSGVRLVDDDEAALAAVRSTLASHAVTFHDQGTPLRGLAPVPHAIALAANAPNADAGRRVIDWLVSEAAPVSARLSAWRGAADGLEALRGAAPPLDVEWGALQYSAARRRWAQSGFGPTLDTT
jgi:ABC-type Fe3+ transport system substrate-binding protein